MATGNMPCSGPDCPICKMFEEARMQDQKKTVEKVETPAVPLPFKEWCEVNGRAWVGTTERSFEDYEKYLKSFEEK